MTITVKDASDRGRIGVEGVIEHRVRVDECVELDGAVEARRGVQSEVSAISEQNEKVVLPVEREVRVPARVAIFSEAESVVGSAEVVPAVCVPALRDQLVLLELEEDGDNRPAKHDLHERVESEISLLRIVGSVIAPTTAAPNRSRSSVR